MDCFCDFRPDVQMRLKPLVHMFGSVMENQTLFTRVHEGRPVVDFTFELMHEEVGQAAAELRSAFSGRFSMASDSLHAEFRRRYMVVGNSDFLASATSIVPAADCIVCTVYSQDADRKLLAVYALRFKRCAQSVIVVFSFVVDDENLDDPMFNLRGSALCLLRRVV